MTLPISVVILTFNAEATVARTLESAARISDDIHVVDSGSTDGTLAIVRAAGAAIAAHPFVDYGAQRNWAIDHLELRHGWQLHLDADERLSDAAVTEIQALVDEPGIDGYLIPRLVHFMEQPIRHGGMYPIYHARLFRTGRGRVENRRYDQHFQISGAVRPLRHPMIDDIRMALTEWTARHNRWSDLALEDALAPQPGRIEGRLFGNPLERKRWLRERYGAAPLGLRALALVFYRYILRRGIPDGQAGLIFFVLQCFWFNFLIDAKLWERRRLTASCRETAPP